MKDLELLRKVIREEVGRNFHTINSDPYTYADFQDYDIQIDGSSERGFFLTVYFSGKKIAPTQRFGTQQEANHAARMFVDKHRVSRMNDDSKEKIK